MSPSGSSLRTRLFLGALGAMTAAAGARALPVVAPGYGLSVFATAPGGSSAPDSIAVVGRDVFVGYGNGGDPAGLNGAVSTIAKYSSGGALLGSISVTGHNDGLRYNAQTGQLWAIQNEDGNPNLVLINPATLAQNPALPFSSTPHGGGYDDVAFGSGVAYVSASNPANNPNTAPAIVNVAPGATQVGVNAGGVLAANATASVINGGGSVTLNLQDPDSLIFAPDGRLVLDSQGDKQLVFVSDVGTIAQSVAVLNLPQEVDDTVFAAGGVQRLLFSATHGDTVYALTGSFGVGEALSALDLADQIDSVNLSTGAQTPLVSGVSGPHGEAFAPGIPEPATWAMMIVGVIGAGAVLRRRSRAAAVM